MRFSPRKDIFNHKDIFCFLFFNNSSIFFMINVYPDDYHLALKYLKNTEVNLQNVLIMAGDFNIKDNSWNPLHPFHLIYSDIFLRLQTLLIFVYLLITNRFLLDFLTMLITQTWSSIYSSYNSILVNLITILCILSFNSS